MSTYPPPSEPVLHQARHVKYWTRCLKTLLPHHYTGNEGNRMYLAFMMLSAVDLLDMWPTVATPEEKGHYIDWIYRCQHPLGGFRMWPGTDFDERRSEQNAKWDPANVPATFFALASLLIVGDDLSRVKRRDTLDWIHRMQRDDGSFGETIVDGQINGGKDPRFGYCATGARYILRGPTIGPLEIDGQIVDDIDVDALVHSIRNAESYDGGIADEPFHEPHAGYEFCALGALNFVGRLNTPETPPGTAVLGPSDPLMTIRWLVERQTDLEEPEDEAEEEVGDMSEPVPNKTTIDSSEPSLNTLHQSPDKSTCLPQFDLEPLVAGMNGRTNKVADTCYAWWVGASFHLMGQPGLYCRAALRRYLLVKTQHPALGGFGKFPGDLPDLYHSYLGLAALGLVGTEGVREVDPAMCVSKRASARLSGFWKAWSN